MGSIFASPVGARRARGGRRRRSSASSPAAASRPTTTRWAALCLGAEREGLPDEIAERCDRLWTIPLREGGAESLNVAAAAAIALGRISSAARRRREPS